MSIYNKTFPNLIKVDDNITSRSGYTNTSLRNDGKTELRGDIYLTNSSKLIIGKNKNTTTNYEIDCQNNVNIYGAIFCNLYRGLGTFLIGYPTGQAGTITSLIIGSNDPFSENSLGGGLGHMEIRAKRNGKIDIGSQLINNICAINIYSNDLKIGGGAWGSNSSIIIGASNTASTYYNTVNICASTVTNILNIGSSVSNVNI